MDQNLRGKFPGFVIQYSNLRDEMAAFDDLPPELRAILRNAPVKFSAISVAEQLQKNSVKSLVALLRLVFQGMASAHVPMRKMANTPSRVLRSSSVRDPRRPGER